jgi:general secretion pathway protein M
MNRTDLANWYGGLAPRDQRILRIGGVAILLIFCVGILLPLQRNLSRTRAQVETQQTDLEWMRSVAPTLAAAGPGPAVAATRESLVVLVDRSARESGLAQSLTGSQPSGNGALRVQLEKADFNLLVGWLSRLSAQQGIRVESASVSTAGVAGIVNASVLLQVRESK